MADSYYRFCDECKEKVPFIRGGIGRILCYKCSGGKEDTCTDCRERVGGVQQGEGFVRCSRCHSYYVEMHNGLPHEVEIRALRLNMLSVYQRLLTGRDVSNHDMYDTLIQSLLETLDMISLLLDGTYHDRK